MKKIFLYLISILFFSCEIENNITKSKPYAGKVKQWIEYTNDGDTSRSLGFVKYLFTYDSIKGNVQKLSYIQIRDTFTYEIPLLNVESRSNNVIRVRYESTSPPRIFNVYTNGKQVTSIKEIDNGTGIENNASNIYSTNNETDSIFDVGYDPTFNGNILLKNFNYVNNNCISYQQSYGGTILFPTTSYYYVSDTLNLSYTNLPNTNYIRYQMPGNLAVDNSSIFRIIVLDFLSVDGFYLVPKNANLIDSIRKNDVVQKFEYTYTGNRVTKLKNQYIKPNFPIQNYNNYIDYY